jgi:hypothetical protein
MEGYWFVYLQRNWSWEATISSSMYKLRSRGNKVLLMHDTLMVIIATTFIVSSVLGVMFAAASDDPTWIITPIICTVLALIFCIVTHVGWKSDFSPHFKCKHDPHWVYFGQGGETQLYSYNRADGSCVKVKVKY